MQGVGKIHSGLEERQGLNHYRVVFDCDMGQAQYIGQCFEYDEVFQSVTEAQHPFGFEQYGFANENFFTLEQGGCAIGLNRVVSGEQTDEDIGVNCDHEWP